jgi:hypothetical protein
VFLLISVAKWEWGLGTWWVYLTHQVAIIELLYFALATVSTALAVFGSESVKDTPWPVQASWALADITPCLVLIVYALHHFPNWFAEFSVVADPSIGLLHSYGWPLLMTDLMASRHPLELSHVWSAFIVLAYYVCFSYVYWRTGGTVLGFYGGEWTDAHERHYIYEFLDWSGEHKVLEKSNSQQFVQVITVIVTLAVYVGMVGAMKLSDHFSCCATKEKVEEKTKKLNGDIGGLGVIQVNPNAYYGYHQARPMQLTMGVGHHAMTLSAPQLTLRG